MALPRGAKGLSAVCDCGISCSYSLTIFYTTLTNFSTKYLVICKVYTDAGGIKQLNHVCSPVHKIIHSLKLVDYLYIQADNPCYNYHLHTDF